MATIFEQCKTLKEELDSLRPLSKEDELRIMQKFRLDWNYHSNHLEGNSLTYGETKALILFGITAQGKPLKDHFEVTGHNEAISWVLSLVEQDRPLTENFVRELHKLILKEPYQVPAITSDGQPTKKWVKVGEYKTTPNHVKTETGEMFRFATPEETPAMMNDLIQWYKEKSSEPKVNPVLLASEFHYRYIRIHPFDDGNGRTARILMNFILLRFGYPPVIVKTEDKHNYFAALQQADAGIIKPFFEYIADNLKTSLDIMIAGANGESVEEKDDLDKEIALLEQSVSSVGKTIELTKSKESVLDVFDKSIVPLSKYFLSKSELLDRFYIEKKYSIRVGDQSFLSTDNGVDILELVRYKIIENTSIVELEYYYSTFNKEGFEVHDQRSYIRFQFDVTKYYVMSSNKFSAEYYYGENLIELEIKSIIDSEIRRHKDFIQGKVDALKSK